MKNILLLSLFISLHVEASQIPGNRLRITVSVPDSPLDWSAPGGVVKSLLKERLRLKKNPYGLVTFKVSCRKGTVGPITMVPDSFDVVAPLVFQGKGLGYFYATHVGRMSREEAQSGKKRSFTIGVNDDQCERISDFISEFEKKKIHERWGLPHRPLMGEGGTSASLTAAVLKVAGLMTEVEMDPWERAVYLPKKFSGEPLSDQYVFFLSLLGADWGKANEESVPLKFFDPQLIYNWIGTGEKFLDRSALPAPQGQFWEQATDPTYIKIKTP